MHYPLHLTAFLAGFWILQDGVSTAKTVVSSEVLTLLAKNVASNLSSTLLSESHSSNQSSTNKSDPLKRIQEVQTLLGGENSKPEGSALPLETSSPRYERFRRGHRSSRTPQGAEGFQNEHIRSNAAEYSKYPNLEAYRQYEFAANRQIPEDQVNVENPENINSDARGNSINIDTSSLHYSNGYHHPRLSQPNNYGDFGFYQNYHQTPAAGRVQQSEPEVVNPGGGNLENVRLTNRPYNLAIHQGPYHPYHSQYRGQPGFFHPNGQGGNDQPSASGNEQDESNPAKLTDDQKQGQTALPGYGYNPHFHYRPYHGGFYGPPDFYYRPFNGSFHPGPNGPDGGNGTNGPFPYGPFNGYGFNPYGPYNYYGGKPQQQNPSENAGNSEQSAENGQDGGNGTVNRPPYGFPPYGPYYGDFPFYGYPSAPFNGVPYHRFGHGFHDYFKGGPYFNFHPYNFPLYNGPYGGFYPNYGPPGMPGNSEKPAQPEKNTNEGGNSEAPVNSDAEVLSESKSEIVRSLSEDRYENLPFSWPVTREGKFSGEVVLSRN